MLELAARLTEEHIEKAKELLDKGLPEYAVAAKLGIPHSTWKYWKHEARAQREIVNQGIAQLREEGLLAKDGTILGFMVTDQYENTLHRAGTREDALLWIKKHEKDGIVSVEHEDSDVVANLSNPKLVSIEDETEDIEELLRIKTDLSHSSIKILTLLDCCEKGRAYAIDKALTGVIDAGEDDWKAYAWYLERTDREHFGRHETVKHEGGLGLASVELSSEEEDQFKKNLIATIGGNFNE